MFRVAPQHLSGSIIKFGSACDGCRTRSEPPGCGGSQERQHGFNAGEGNDGFCRFMRHVVNVSSWGRILREQSTGASSEVGSCFQPFSVCPVCSLLGQDRPEWEPGFCKGAVTDLTLVEKRQAFPVREDCREYSILESGI